jgi:hypothetical protein
MRKKELEKENEINKMLIERLLERIFCDKKLDEEEIDILFERYPAEMARIALRNNIKDNKRKDASAKIGFTS